MSRKIDTRYNNSNRQREDIRNNSPIYDKYARQRKPDSSVDELIRFVRENQSPGQPSALRLQRLAPLPSIGQLQTQIDETSPRANYNISGNGSEESEADDGLGDSNPDLDDDLDFEIAACTDNFFNTDDAVHLNITNNISNSSKLSGKKIKATKRSRTGRNSSTELCTSDTLDPLKVPRSRKLPPLQRGEFINRPSAPAPCQTPEEVETSEEFNMEEEEDLIDYIDFS